MVPRPTFLVAFGAALLSTSATPYDPIDECPAATPGACPGALTDSNLWARGLLQKCASGEAATVSQDPIHGAILRVCEDPNDRTALGTGCADVRFVGAARSADSLYLSTLHSINKLALGPPAGAVSAAAASAVLVGGFTELRLRGFNLGATAADLASITVRGIECTTPFWVSSEEVGCRIGDPAVLSQGPVHGACVVVTTTVGLYRGLASEMRALQHVGSGFSTPIVFEATTTDLGFMPHAVAVDDGPARTVYWSNLAAARLEAASSADGSGLRVVLEGAARVFGLALGDGGETLYYTDARHGTVSKVPASGGGPSVALVTGLGEPRGLALDDGTLYFTDAATGHVLSARADGGNLERSPHRPEVFTRRLVDAETRSRLDGLAVLPAAPGASRFAADRRLLWTEANTDRLMRATADGLKPAGLSAAPVGGGSVGMLWPRAIVADPDGQVAYVTEYLGRVWRVPLAGAGEAVLLLDEATYASALQVRSVLEDEPNGAFLAMH